MSFALTEVDDSDIRLLSQHHELLGAFFYGSGDPDAWDWLESDEIEAVKSLVPESWPSDGHKMVLTEINADTVEVYHLSLTGSLKPADGVRSLFQTWMGPGYNHTAVQIGDDNAFYSDQLPELRDALRTVDANAVRNAIPQWIERHRRTKPGIRFTEEEVLMQFGILQEVTERAVKSGQGLAWFNQ